MADKHQDKASAYGKVIAKAWRDPSFKAKLLADPQGTLRQAGVTHPCRRVGAGRREYRRALSLRAAGQAIWRAHR